MDVRERLVKRVETELKKGRRYTGLSVESIDSHMPTVVAAFGAPRSAFEWVAHELSELSDMPMNQALRSAYAIGSKRSDGLEARRERFARGAGKTVRTVQRLEDEAIERLANIVVAKLEDANPGEYEKLTSTIEDRSLSDLIAEHEVAMNNIHSSLNAVTSRLYVIEEMAKHVAAVRDYSQKADELMKEIQLRLKVESNDDK
ncbi:hypothetical protein GS464_29435 [Rhodococcus hoagii]|nr:hypothetical protein [Prescottella equi]